MLAHRSSRLIKGLFNGVMVLGLAAAFLGSLQVWQKRGVTSEAAAAGPIILINETGFDPVTLTVSLDEAVTWLNNTSQPVEIGSSRHCYQYLPLLVAGEDEGNGVAAAAASHAGNAWHSGLIAPGDIYSTTFAIEGNYVVYLDCRYDVNGTIMARLATPTPMPTHTRTPPPTPTKTRTPSPTPSYTPSLPTATTTPGPSPTSTPLNTPTPSLTASNTSTPTPSKTPTSTIVSSPTAQSVCPTQFESVVVAGDQFVSVSGEIYYLPTSTVHVYWISNGTNILIGEGQLWDSGPGHPCQGHADIIIDPEFALVANMLIVVTNLVDGTYDFTFVLPATPTPIAPP